MSSLAEKQKKTKSTREFIDKDHSRTTKTKDGFYTTRDISHLKDSTSHKLNPRQLPLPTDMGLLEKLYSRSDIRGPHTFRTSTGLLNPISCIKDMCFDHVLRRSGTDPPLDFSAESIDRYFLGNPTGRQEVENLCKWLKYMKQLSDSKGDEPKNLLLVYSMCLREIIRQVSVQCLERGKLLRKVVIGIEESYKNRENTLSAQLDNANIKYSKDVQSTRNKNVDELEKKNQELIYQIQRLKDEKKDALNNTRELELQMEILKEQYVKLDLKHRNFAGAFSSVSPQMNLSILPTAPSSKPLPQLSLETTTIGIPSNVTLELHRRSLSATRVLWTTPDTIDSGVTEAPYEVLRLVEDEITPPGLHHQSWQLGFTTGFNRGRIVGNEEAELFSTDSEQQSTARKQRKRRTSTSSMGEISDRSEDDSLQDSATQRLRKLKTLANPYALENVSDESLSSDSEFSSRNNSKPKKLKPINTRLFLSSKKAAKHRKKCTKIIEFNWGKKKNFNVNGRKSLNTGSNLLQKMLDKNIDWIQRRGSMTRKMVHKLIYTVLSAAIAKGGVMETQEFVEIAYGDFLRRYCLKPVADRKFVDFIGSLFRCNSPKSIGFVRLARAGHIINQESYSKSSLNFFLMAFKYITQSKLGMSIHLEDFTENLLLPKIRATEFLKDKGEKTFEKPVVLRLLGWVDKSTVPDSKRVNSQGLIDFDSFLLEITNEYELLYKEVYQGVYALFDAVMTDMDYLTRPEYEMIMRHINKKKLSEHKQKYTFEDVVKPCIDDISLSIRNIRKLLAERGFDLEEAFGTMSELIKEIAPFYRTQWETLTLEVFTQRLEFLKESRQDFPESLTALGLFLYSEELLRIKNEFMNSS